MVEKQLNKEKANANMYYNLFADKIGKFNNDENILLIHIGNFDVISKFIVNNVNCNYFIIDQHLNGNYLKLNFPQIHFFGSEEDESIIEVLEQIDMKFDKIIMNPPYSKNLHLKILAEAIKHLNEDGECVNLSPIRWLQDPLAKYKKSSDLKRFEDNVAKHIESIELIKTEDANKIFNILLLQPLCIYKCNNKNTNKIYIDFNTTNLLDKIFSKIIDDGGFSKMTKIQFKDNLKNFVIINKMAPPMKYGRPMFDAVKTWCGPFINGINSKNETYREAKKNCKASVVGDIEKDTCVVFDTGVEVKNCYASLNSTFSRFVTMKSVVDIHVHQQFLPWMGDCINPRTGLKGYKSEWTNEDFYTYFNITKEEQELIEKTMEKYK